MHSSTKFVPEFRLFTAETTNFLDSLGMFGWKLGLQRITRMAHELGDPQLHYPVIHIAGSNGKGSVAGILERIYRQQGCSTGLYTSPHLLDPTERIRISGQIIPESEFEQFLSEIKPVLIAHKATYFEALTLLAFLIFYEKKIDMAFLEVGLGGRFDATNIVAPACTIITSISLEHTNYLGDSVAKIAAEKAGIVKSGAPCIIGDLPVQAVEVIRGRCKELGAPFYESQDAVVLELEEIDSDGMHLCRQQGNRKYSLQTRLTGTQQIKNIKTALAAIDVLQEKFPCSQHAVEQGIEKVQLRGRFQFWHKSPHVVLDVAHNCESMHFLNTTLRQVFGDRNYIFIIGLLADKNVQPVVQELKALHPYIFCVTPKSDRALTAADLLNAIAANDLAGQVAVDLATAFSRALELSQPDAVIVICGSHFVVGQFLREAAGFRLMVGNNI